MTDAPESPREPIAEKLGMVAIELAILGAAWWYLGLHTYLVGSIAGVIITAGLVPRRFASLLSGVGLLGVAALVYFYFGAPQLAGLMAVAAVVIAILGLLRLKSARSGPE